eukprot:scaffold114366_cov31-Prasinocladus_malaysianus.AAC.1
MGLEVGVEILLSLHRSRRGQTRIFLGFTRIFLGLFRVFLDPIFEFEVFLGLLVGLGSVLDGLGYDVGLHADLAA